MGRVQYAHSSTTPSNASYADVDLDGYVLGLDYNLNATTRLFIAAATVKTEGDERIGADAVTDSTAALGFDLRF